MAKPREDAHLQMARAIALLMAGTPMTHSHLRDAVGVHKDVPAGWTVALRAVGAIYISGWQMNGHRGPWMAAWAWQPSPFFYPDVPRPIGKVRPRTPNPERDLSRERRQAAADAKSAARAEAIAVRKARLAAEALTREERRVVNEAARAAVRQAKANAKQAKANAKQARVDATFAAAQAAEETARLQHAAEAHALRETAMRNRSVFDMAGAA